MEKRLSILTTHGLKILEAPETCTCEKNFMFINNTDKDISKVQIFIGN